MYVRTPEAEAKKIYPVVRHHKALHVPPVILT